MPGVRSLTTRRRERRVARPARGGEAGAKDLGAIVAKVTDDRLEPSERRRAVVALAGVVGSSAREAGVGAVVQGRWLADVLLEVAPRLAVRDRATLQRHHPGLTDDELAAFLVAAAVRATAAIGAAGGAVAAVQWTASPTLASVPVQIVAQTLAVAAVEIKLLAELHEVYGTVPAGGRAQRAMSYVVAWVRRRGVDPLDPAALRLVLGVAARREVRRRVVRRAGLNLATLGPLMAGAVAGSAVNRRETSRLAQHVLADLRRERPGPATSPWS